MSARAAELIAMLQLSPHPEGGHYREVFRADQKVTPHDGRAARSALTSIDFLLQRGEFSAWHRVASDEAWHLLEGGPLRLWCLSPSLDGLSSIELGTAGKTRRAHHVVPAGWWQAAEPLGDFSYVAAVVGPGFDFADFTFAREHADVMDAITRLQPPSLRLMGPRT